MIPRNHEYIHRLKFNLEKIGVQVKILKPFHYSTLSNIAKMFFFRVKGYRIIHVHWLYIFPLTFVMKGFYYFCKMLGIKIIWEMHNIIPHKNKEINRRNSKWFYEKSDAVIFHSKSDIVRTRELLETNVDKEHIVIPHGNFNESYENKVSKEEARRILNIPDNKRMILCFGFIRKNRGYQYLIEAIKDAQDIIVVVAGKVEDKDTYKKLLDYKEEISNLKIFAEWISEDEMQIYFNACDIVVLPYTHITTSGVIPLAYAFSRPVVTTGIGGIKDIVNDKTGILVPPEDTDALREAIDRIFNMDIEGMGRYAYEYAQREFSWESNALQIKGLYDLLCNSKRVQSLKF